MTEISGSKRISTICLAVLAQYRTVMLGQRDGITQSISRLVFVNTCGHALPGVKGDWIETTHSL